MNAGCNSSLLRFVTALLFAALALPAEATRYHVKYEGGDDNDDGLFWSSAFKTVQKAIDAARNNPTPPHEIWVAAATYYPDEGPSPIVDNDPEQTFEMLTFVSLYGGFVGNETTLEQRDYEMNETVLSGDIDQDGLLDGNSWHILTFQEVVAGDNPTAVVDGFTIREGYANGTNGPTPADDINILGGGAVLSLSTGDCVDNIMGALGPTFRNCRFEDNKAAGAGGAIGGCNIGVVLENCVFKNNEAEDFMVFIDNRGGGAVSVTGDMHVIGCTFVNNTSQGAGTEVGRGGALENNGQNLGQDGVKVVNCKFLNNQTNGNGGGASLEGDGYVVNCLFAGNRSLGTGAPGSALEGGGGLRATVGMDVLNCTFVDNQAEDAELDNANGGGLLFHGMGDPPIVRNCIFWGNSADATTDWTAQLIGNCCPTFCDIQDFDPGDCDTDPTCNPGTCVGAGNECDGVINQEPLFVDPDGPDKIPYTEDDDYRLLICSPCVETGDPDATLIPCDEFDVDDDDDGCPGIQPGNEEATPDPDLNDRVQDNPDSGPTAVADMGVYEVPSQACPYDCGNGGNGAVDVIDLLEMLAEWGLDCTQVGVTCDLAGGPGVDVVDLLALLGSWGPCGQPPEAPPQSVQDCIDRYGLEDPIVLEQCICAVDPCEEGCPPAGCQ